MNLCNLDRALIAGAERQPGGGPTGCQCEQENDDTDHGSNLVLRGGSPRDGLKEDGAPVAFRKQQKGSRRHSCAIGNARLAVEKTLRPGVFLQGER